MMDWPPGTEYSSYPLASDSDPWRLKAVKAEVERLTAELADRDAAIQRVREVCGDEDQDEGGYGYDLGRAVGWNNLRADILDALDGGDDA